MNSPRRKQKETWKNHGYQEKVKRSVNHVSNDDISILLDRWYEAKQDLKDLEEKIEKYKKVATKLMKDSDSNVLSSNKYTLTRREMVSTRVLKADLPQDLWKQFSTTSRYPAFYLAKN
jgi:hypothetical protein